MSHRKLSALIIATLVLRPVVAEADPQPMPTEQITLRSGEGELCLKVTGKCFTIPQMSRVLAPPAADRVDAELRRLQDAETRLAAENKHMRERVSGWSPGWKTLAVTMLTGIATGVYLGLKI